MTYEDETECSKMSAQKMQMLGMAQKKGHKIHNMTTVWNQESNIFSHSLLSSPAPCIHHSTTLTTCNQGHSHHSNKYQHTCFHIYQSLIYILSHFMSFWSPYPHISHNVSSMDTVVSLLVRCVEDITSHTTRDCYTIVCTLTVSVIWQTHTGWHAHTFTLFNKTIAVMLTPWHTKYISKDSLLGYCTMWDREVILMFQMRCCLHLQGTSSNHNLYSVYH